MTSAALRLKESRLNTKLPDTDSGQPAVLSAVIFVDIEALAYV